MRKRLVGSERALNQTARRLRRAIQDDEIARQELETEAEAEQLEARVRRAIPWVIGGVVLVGAVVIWRKRAKKRRRR